MRVAIVSHVLPPSSSGQAVVLSRLLRNLQQDNYCLISCQSYDSRDLYSSNATPRLPARYYQVSSGFQLSGPRVVRLLSKLANAGPDFFRRIWDVTRIVKRERCSAILACTGDLFDLPIGFLASRLVGIPFYAYVFDDYVYQWPQTLLRLVSGFFAPVIFKGATGVIVPNEFLRDEYRRCYGIQPVVIHNPCDISELDVQAETAWPSDEGEIKIIYTGAIYHAHYDAFRNLLAAIQQPTLIKVKLHVYTAQPRASLQREGIDGPVIYHPHVAISHVAEVHRQADILFLPLAFNSPIPEAIRTSAPGKMGEYLASGRAILVHAPPDSFVSWYFEKHRCGVVIGQNEPALLAQAIKNICEDANLRRQIGENARACARADFSLERAQAQFIRLFQNERHGLEN